MFIKSIQCFFILLTCTLISAQSPLGKWKTIDDKTGIAKSIIEITEANGLYKATIIELLEEEYEGKNPVCEPCKGDKKDSPVIGLEIMWDMKKTDDNSWSDGRILDPENGKTYGCKLSLENDDKLKVRGFLGFAAFGRNQFWHRA